MPLLVRKKLVSADCACAGALARVDMAASAKHAGETILAKLFIWFLPAVFWFVGINTSRRPLFRRQMKRAFWQRKRRRGTNRSAFLVTLWRSAGLLDRREFPIGAAPPGEGPYFGGFDRRFAAGDQTAGGALQGLVDQREPHRHAGEIGFAFTPGFREGDLQQQADDRRQAAEAGEQAAAEQHAE